MRHIHGTLRPAGVSGITQTVVAQCPVWVMAVFVQQLSYLLHILPFLTTTSILVAIW